jgi:pimeloyl-ACP methyl ester carboxylesterase
MSHKFQSEYADVNGMRLHYVSAGRGKLIMFVHGFPEFWAEWENQLIEFGRDHQAVAVDMRGYNLSSKPACPRLGRRRGLDICRTASGMAGKTNHY